LNRLRYLGHIVNLIAEWVGQGVAWLACVAAVLILYEVISRYIFNNPTIWVHETSGFLFAALSLLAGAYCLRHGYHVKMDFLYFRWSPRIRAIADLVTSPLTFVFCAILLWKGGEYAWTSLTALETSSSSWAPPVYPFKLLLPLAAFLVLAVALVKFIRDFALAINKGEGKSS